MGCLVVCWGGGTTLGDGAAALVLGFWDGFYLKRGCQRYLGGGVRVGHSCKVSLLSNQAAKGLSVHVGCMYCNPLSPHPTTCGHTTQMVS